MAVHNDSNDNTPTHDQIAENYGTGGGAGDGNDGVGDMFAQKVETITVPSPDANKVVTIKVEAGRTLRLEFNNYDVVKREVVDDDLVLTFKNGGKIVLQEYMEAFGLMADIPTKVVQADGKSFLLPDLLDVASKPPASTGTRTDTADAGNQPVVVDRPGEGQDQVVNLRFGRDVKFNFKSTDVANSTVDGDGNLILGFQDGGTVKLVGWQAVAAKASLKAMFQDRSLALIELPNTAAGDDLADGNNSFGETDVGQIGPGIDHLGPLGNEELAFKVPDPDPPQFPPPSNPPMDPPGGNPPNVLPPVIGVPGGGVAPPVIGVNTPIREDTSATGQPVTFQINTQRGGDELVSFRLVNVPADFDMNAGTILVTTGAPANTPLTATVTVSADPFNAGMQQVFVQFDLSAHPGLDQAVIRIMMESPEDSDVDDLMVIHATTRSEADATLMATTYASYVQQVDAVLDQAADVNQISAAAGAANSAAGIDLNFDVSLVNAGFANSQVGGPDTDGSERITTVRITLSDTAANLVGDATFPATVQINNLGGGVFELTAAGGGSLQTVSVADVEQAIEALAYVPSAGFSGAMSGTIETTTAETLQGASVYSPLPPPPPTLGTNGVPNPLGPDDQITFVPEPDGEATFNNSVTDILNFTATVQAPTFTLVGDTTVLEGTAGEPDYAISVSGLLPSTLQAGETLSVDVSVNLPGGLGAASPADFVESFLTDLQDAAALAAGVTVADQGGGVVRVTFDNTAAVTFSFELPTLDDVLVEGSESFTVSIANPMVNGAAGGTVAGTGQVTTIINDNDTLTSPTQIGVEDVVIDETAGTATFNVIRTGDLTGTSTVSYGTQDVDATAGADYVATFGSLTWNPGESTKQVTVQLIDDLIDDPKETFNVILSNVTGAVIADPKGVAVITNVDPFNPTKVMFSSVSVDEDAGTATLTVLRTGDLSGTSIITYDTADASATAGLDYVAQAGTLTFNPGETSKTIDIVINDDTLAEPIEEFAVNLTSSIGAIREAETAYVTINDNDQTGLQAPTQFNITSETAFEEDGTVTFTITRSGDLSAASTVDYATADGTATAGLDYTATNGTVTFLAGEFTKTITIGLLDDSVSESVERFYVNLTNPTNGAIADPTGIATVPDRDGSAGATRLYINNVVVGESDGTATFTVTRLGDVSGATTVQFATADGSALAGPDYLASTGSITFNAGETSKTIDISIVDDFILEPLEVFTVNLSNVTGGDIVLGSGTGTIIDNDQYIRGYIINDVSVLESAGSATFTVTRLGDLTEVSTVDFATADSSATNPDDYLSVSGTLTFGIGASTQTITVPIVDDTIPGGDESFTVELSNPTNSGIFDPTGIGTIIDDDAFSHMSINDVTVDESAGSATFTVTRVGNLSGPAFVDFNTSDGTAIAGADYATTSGTLSFADGEASKTITVAIIDDAILENPEQFIVELSEPNRTLLGDNVGVGTILDNDGPSVPATRLYVNDVTVREDAGVATFTVTRLGDISGTTTLDVATSNGTALAGPDYTTTVTSLTFAAGVTSVTFDVPIVNDLVVEPLEEFTVTLQNVVGGEAIDSVGIGRIADDDTLGGPTQILIFDTTVNESDGTATFSVLRGGDTTTAFTVDYVTQNGNATQPADYTLTTGTLTFAAGEVMQTIVVPITDDAIFENPEHFLVNLSNATNNVAILDATGVGTIIDDDTRLPDLQWNLSGDLTVDEGADASYTLSKTGEPIQAGQTVTIDLSITYPGGRAGAEESDFDYTTNPTAFDFAQHIIDQLPGGITATRIDSNSVRLSYTSASPTDFAFDLSTLDDLFPENSESYALSIQNQTAGTVQPGGAAAVTTILDNETTPTGEWELTGDLAVFEGNSAAYTVSYTGAPLNAGQTVSVDLDLLAPGTGPGVADEATDFATPFANAIIAAAAGVTGVTATNIGGGVVRVTYDSDADPHFQFSLDTLADAVAEGNENYSVVMFNASFGTTVSSLKGIAQTVIIDDDLPPSDPVWQIAGSAAVIEGDAGAYTIVRAAASGPVAGETLDIQIDLPGGLSGAEAADFAESFVKDLNDALPATVTATDLGNGTARLTFQAGAPGSLSFTLPTFDDALIEDTESYALSIVNPSEGSVDTDHGQVVTRILDNDLPPPPAPPTLFWELTGDASVTEGGTPTYQLDVSGDPIPVTRPQSIDLALTLPGGLSGAEAQDFIDAFAQDLQDALPQTGITVVGTTVTFDSTAIPPFTFALPTLDDAIDEFDESYAISIQNQTAGEVVGGAGVVQTVILDNDGPGASGDWQITGDLAVLEGNEAHYTVSYVGTTLTGAQTASIELNLANISTSAADFSSNLLTEVLNAAAATPGVSAVAAGGGNVTLTFDASASPHFTFGVDTADDVLVEGDELFSVNLLNPSAGTTVAANKASASTTIIDNDTTGDPVWTISGDGAVVEGGAPTYTVARTGDPIAAGEFEFIDIEIDLPGNPGGAEEADFIAAFLADLQAAAGGGVNVSVLFDQITLSFSDTAPASFTFSLPTFDDTLVEDTESYAIAITNQSAGTIDSDHSAVVTKILDNDSDQLNLVWTLSGDALVTEGGAAAYALALTGDPIPAGETVSIDLAPTLPGGLSGAEAADFIDAFAQDLADAAGTQAGITVTGTTVTFDSTAVPPFSFTLPTLDDLLDENDEAYAVSILNPTDGAIGAGGAVVVTTIVDNDGPGVEGHWQITGDTAVIEGGTAGYTVSYTGTPLSGSQTATVQLDLNAPGGAGVADEATDFTTPFVNLVLLAAGGAAGVSAANLGGGIVELTFDASANPNFSFGLPTLQDVLVEGNETYSVDLLNPGAGTTVATGKGSAATTIIDDDNPPADPVWAVVGTNVVVEGGAPAYTLFRFGQALGAGETESVELQINLPAGPGGASAADFEESFLQDLQDAAALTPGVSVVGNVVTFDSTAPANFSFSLPTFDDTIFEGNEAFAIAAVNPTNGQIDPAHGTVATRIIDNDAPDLNIVWTLTGDSSVQEGLTPAYQLAFNGDPITAPTTVAIQVNANLPGGVSGAEAADFVDTFVQDILDAAGVATGISATDLGGGLVGLTIDATATSPFNFGLPTLDDLLDENNESYTISILNPSAGVVSPGGAAVLTTILDNDGPFGDSWQITGDTAVTEGNAADYTVTYSGPTLTGADTASVDIGLLAPGGAGFADAGDFSQAFAASVAAAAAATAGVSFDGVSTLTFDATAGPAFQFSLPTLDDALVEGAEDYSVQLSNPSAGTTIAAGKDTATTTIADNDSPVVMWQITGDASVDEGGVPAYELTRVGPAIGAGQSESIDLQAVLPGGPGGADMSDFIETFAKDLMDAAAVTPGVSVAGLVVTFDDTAPATFSFSLPTYDDTMFEGTEAFSIALANPSNGSVDPAADTIVTRILDNDTPDLNIVWTLTGDSTVQEGGAPAYQVSFSGDPIPAGQSASIDLSAILPGGLSGAEAADFVDAFAQDLADSLVGQPGFSIAGTILTVDSTAASPFNFTLPTADDVLDELDESFAIAILNPTAGTVSPGGAAVQTTILDNDGPNGDDWQVTGQVTVGEGNDAAYVVSYTGPDLTAGQTVSIDIGLLAPGGAGLAAPADFSEAFVASVAAAAAGAPGVSFDGAATLTFDATANPNFLFTLPTLDDALVEGAENYSVQIANPSGATTIAPGKDTATTTILDNDIPGQPVEWQLSGDAAVNEGGVPEYTLVRLGDPIEAGQSQSVVLEIDLPGGPGGASQVDFLETFLEDLQDAAGATPGVSVSGNVVTFDSAAPASFTFALPTFDDLLFEGNEAYTVSVTNPTEGTITPGAEAVVTRIIDNDTPDGPNLRWTLEGDQTVPEGGAADYQVYFTGDTIDPGAPVTIDLAITLPGGLSGAEVTDFVAAFQADVAAAAGVTTGVTASGLTLTIDSTATSPFNFSLPTLDDLLDENNESYAVAILNQSSGLVTAGGAAVQTTILDNDGPGVSDDWQLTGDLSVGEGNDATYTVSYTGPDLTGGDTASIDVGIAFNTATGADFTEAFLASLGTAAAAAAGVSLVGNTLTFDATASRDLTFQLPTLDDALVEGLEDFSVALSNPSAGTTIAAGKDTVTTDIVDNDTPGGDPLTWQLAGSSVVPEGGVPVYTVTHNATLGAGDVISVELQVELPGGIGGASAADFEEGFLQDVAQAAAATPGVTLVGTSLFFDSTAPNSIDIPLPTFDDLIFEGTESYTLTLANASDGAIDNAHDQVITRILDNDRPDLGLVWNIAGDNRVEEGNDAEYTVTFNGIPVPQGATTGIDVALDFSPGPIPAEDADFSETLLDAINDSLIPGVTATIVDTNTVRLTFDSTAPNSFTFDIDVLEDMLPEGEEVYSVVLRNPQDGSIQPSQGAVATIIDDMPTGNAGDDNDQMVAEANLPDGTDPSPPVTASDSVTIDFGAFTDQVDISQISLVASDGETSVVIPNLTSMGRDLSFAQNDLADGAREFVATIAAGEQGAGDEVFRLTISRNGDYDFELSQKIDHPDLDEVGADDPIDLSFTYTAEAGGQSDDGVITIAVKDDGPVAQDDKFVIDEAGVVTTDVVIIFDHSGSMGDNPGVPGFSTRLELARDAVAQLVGQPGIQNVMVVGFDNNAGHANWGTPAEALDAIDSFIASGTTNYAAAIEELMDNFDTGSNPRPPAADVTNVYFLSDGVPVPDNADLSSHGLVGPWENFLQANNIDAAYAVGIGAGVSGGDADLREIAWPNGDPDNPVILLDEGQLADTLLGTLPDTVTGNVLADNGNGEDAFGADGMGQILSIQIDGVTYTYDADADTITPSSGPAIAGSTLSLTTALGGDLTFEFADTATASKGDFAYTSPSVNADAEENLVYTIRDFDGDTSTASFDICITNTPAEMEGKLVINEIGLGVGTAPDTGHHYGGWSWKGGGYGGHNDCKDYVEIHNISTDAVSAGALDLLTLEIVGANGAKVTLDLSGIDHEIPSNGFLTLFQSGEFEITDGSDTLCTGTWTNSPVGWNLGDDTGEPIAVNLVESRSMSIDAFLANGVSTGDLTGAPAFRGRVLPSGSGQQAALAALASLLGVAVQDLLDNEQFNGRIADQAQVLDALGIDLPHGALDSTGEKVFARVYGPADGTTEDTNSVADWTTSNEPTHGAFNTSYGDSNPQDPNDGLNPRQDDLVNDPVAGQTILDATADGHTLSGGRGSDFLYGSDQADVLKGGDNDDMLYGGGGNDMLDGGAGADLLIGGEGDDTLDGGTGDDVLVGGPGNDFFVFGADHGDDIVADFTKGDDHIAFDTTSPVSSFADLAGRISIDGNDTIIQTGGGNSIRLADYTGGLDASDFMFGVAPCAPLAPMTPAALSLQSAVADPDDSYFIFGNSGPQEVSLSDLGVSSGDQGDLVLRMEENAIDGSRTFMVFRAGGDGVIDLATLGDGDGDGLGDAANELSLSFQDVMDLSEVTGGLVIHGRDQDAVSADLRGHAVAAEDHGTFDRYVIDGGSAHLDIDKGVQQHIVTDMG